MSDEQDERDELALLRAIVASVASLDEGVRIYDGKECIFCNAYYGSYSGNRPYDTHDEDCTWLQAKEAIHG